MPLIPEAARRRHRAFVPADHRFKAAARFLQALWREDRGLAIGTHVNPREPGAAYDVDRLKTNLLSSQPLAFNLFGPLAGDSQLATRFVTEFLPGTLTEVTDVLFEHSPGRGDPRFTADRTAYDVVMRGRNATGARGLICIEIKYSEPGHEPAPPPAAHTDRARHPGPVRGPGRPDPDRRRLPATLPTALPRERHAHSRARGHGDPGLHRPHP
ncbi:hypothetical protein MPEAHAMD_4764 [Methylobacterium frigidaeris]|uniref:PD-(D/E)XK nuclease-like domain-containing protein n=1 Tax=Methylobacterium frigidaeris TaxID=2038277 RepID=A0AA37HFG8_9HYPH|nr:hypothetical protein MPEAHAMD_4764 [Methylobacterium frigidaeris]